MQAIAITLAILSPATAMIIQGLHQKTVARMHGKKGPPIMQPFYDAIKLFSKEKLKTKNDIFFLTAPLFYLAAIMGALLITPLRIISPGHDIILLSYLFITANAFRLLAGISSDSPFGTIASMKKVRVFALQNTAIIISIFSFAALAQTTGFSGLGDLALPKMVPTAIALTIAIISETTAKSLLPGTTAEYSGKQLALLNLADALKRFFLISLAATLFAGANALAWIACFTAMFLILAYSEATSSEPTRQAILWSALTAFIIAAVDLARILLVIQ